VWRGVIETMLSVYDGVLDDTIKASWRDIAAIK
jgi:hypothetical protein